MKKLLLFVLMIAGGFQQAIAAPARSMPFVKIQPDGSAVTLVNRGDEWCHWLSDQEGHLMLLDKDGFYRQATQEQIDEWGKAAAESKELREQEIRDYERRMQQATRSGTNSHYTFPTKGTMHGLVVLVEYADVRFSIDDPYQQYSDMMNKPGYNYTNGKYKHFGSAHDYFVDNSMGLFDPQFDVFGPVLLSHDRAYYGKNNDNGNDMRARDMIIEACEILDQQGVDFTQYDADDNGVVDFVFIFFAGEGENASNVTSDAIWPHQWEIYEEHIHDGKRLGTYACTNELYNNRLDGVGTFCHEFSHVLGLPDLYDVTNSNNSNDPNNYSMLSNGCYLNGGYWPIGLSSFERYELGWMTPTPLQKEPASIELKEFGSNNEAYIYQVSSATECPDPRDGEYFMFENRQKTKWDTYLPGHGMLVWHIDYVKKNWSGNKVNTWPDHPCVDLIEADGTQEKQNGSETFPGTAGHSAFTDDTTPAFSGWSAPGTEDVKLGHRLELPITNIRELGDIISFDVMGGLEGIEEISVESSSAEYYTPYGIKESHPTSGIYIVKDKGKSRKMLIAK